MWDDWTNFFGFPNDAGKNGDAKNQRLNDERIRLLFSMMAQNHFPVTKWRWSPQPTPEPDKRTLYKIIKKAKRD